MLWKRVTTRSVSDACWACEDRKSMSAFGTKRTSHFAPHMSAFGGKADIIQGKQTSRNGRLWLTAVDVHEPSRWQPYLHCAQAFGRQ